MSIDFEKRSIEDFGQKLSHLEGLLGAYLPQRLFDSNVQQKTIDCNKFSFSRLRTGARKAANWELARFIDLFDLAKYGFDYRLFFESFTQFDAVLKQAGVGSYGASAQQQLREALRKACEPGANIKVTRDRRLNIGGIGGAEERGGILCLNSWDKVTLRLPLKPSSGEQDYMLLLHDYPDGRATSCLMPSVFAPEHEVTGTNLRLPLSSSGYLSFPVGGKSGYRCLYGIQSPTDLAACIGLKTPEFSIVDIDGHQIATLVDYLLHVSDDERLGTQVSFAEYMLQ